MGGMASACAWWRRVSSTAAIPPSRSCRKARFNSNRPKLILKPDQGVRPRMTVEIRCPSNFVNHFSTCSPFRFTWNPQQISQALRLPEQESGAVG